METLQSPISSSIRDAILPQLPSVHTPPEPTVSHGSSSSLPQHLPPKIITSIRNGEYIDFNSLLSENVDGHDEHLEISFDSLGNSGLSIPVSLTQPKRQRIDSIERWLTAFNTFASVAVHFSPYKASELFAYQQSIRDAQRKFSGMAWYAYDIASHAIPPLNTMQEVRSLAIPNENVNTYINNLSTSTPVNVTYLKHELQFHPNATFVSHLIQGFQEGFRIGFESPARLAFQKILNLPLNTLTLSPKIC